MVADMREMKDSGIDWIGNIPKIWSINKIKYIVQSRSVKYRLSKVGNYIGLENVESSSGHYVKSETEYVDAFYDGCEAGDLLYGKLRPNLAKVLISPYKSCCTGEFEIISSSLVGKKFLQYYMLTEEFTQAATQLTYGAKMPRVNWDDVKEFKIAYPNANEISTIVSFLDSKCSEIDSLAADIQTQIDTLEQYKRSVIFETVSKGIGHLKFKNTDSAVWVSIPEEWALIDIKYLFEIVKRIAGKEGYDILAITQRGIKVKDISTNEGQIAENYRGYQFVYPGDFAMNHMDLLTGWVDLSNNFGVTSPDYRVFKLLDTNNHDRNYYKYVMQCCYMCRIFYSLGQGVSNLGRWRLQTSTFNNFKVPVPPYKEQVIIGKYLDQKIREINSVIDEKQEQLSVLADYKKSLIYEYVTGKKEVPNE